MDFWSFCLYLLSIGIAGTYHPYPLDQIQAFCMPGKLTPYHLQPKDVLLNERTSGTQIVIFLMSDIAQ